MNRNQYLAMNVEELIKYFFSEVIEDYSEGIKKIDDLSKTERYRTDYEFRTTIETARGVALSLAGENSKAISLTKKLVDTASSLKLWELVARNWNVQGIIYLNLAMYEKAVECFHNVVKVEKNHELIRVTASAYSNIGSIFLTNSIYDRACKYYALALDTLKKGGENQARYDSELQYFYGNLALAYSESGNLEPVPDYLKSIKKIGIENKGKRVKYNYYYVKMIYHFYCLDYKNAKRCYLIARENINPESEYDILALTVDFIEKTVKYGEKDGFYEEELLKLEALQESNRNLSNIFIYDRLREYYLEKKIQPKLDLITKKYISYLEKEVKDVAKRQGEAIVAVDEIMCKDDDIEGIRHRNTELELVANEAMKHKNSLEKAYHQIDLINKLGRRITSTIKFNEVIQLIYENIKQNIPTSIFILMVKNENREEALDTIFYNDSGVLMPNISLDLKMVKGLFAECYHKNKIITSYDEDYKSFFEEQRLSQKVDIRSAIYLPLNVDDEVIGICSIQHKEMNAYTEEKIKFLKELLPFLSIALNNAIRSRNLEKEINSHLQTQKELKEVNRRLEILSSLDELTQISGRRTFSNLLIQYIDKAKKNGTSLSIIMLDIDYFKNYNDNYGHLEGDEILKKVAKVFEEIVDGADGLAARFGGEEFIAAFVGLDFETTVKEAEKIRKAIYDLEIPHNFSSYNRVTVSIGVSVSHNISLNEKNVYIKEADDCLYEAKNNGRNRVIGSERYFEV